MISILFIILPYTSHLLAAFDFGRRYKADGHQVVFTGELRHKELIEKEGFVFAELCYAEEYKVPNVKVFLAFIIQSVLGTGLRIERYKTLYATSSTLRKLISKYNVQEVFVDEYIADYYFLIDKHQKVSLVNTRPSTKKVRGVPPLNSSYTPDGGFVSNLVCEWLWAVHLANRKIKEVIRFLAFSGIDEVYFLSRLAKKTGRTIKKK